MGPYIGLKRGKYIGKVNSLLQEFHYVNPEILTKLVNVYATSFYGSGTWDIFSKGCEKLYKSWNVTIRQVFGLHWHTHHYLLEDVSGCLHPKVMLASRYVTFYKSLVNSNKVEVWFMARLDERDKRTVLGKTLQTILEDCELADYNMADLSANMVKQRCSYKRVPEPEKWRPAMLKELLLMKEDKLTLGNFDDKEIEEIIQHLCIS